MLPVATCGRLKPVVHYSLFNRMACVGSGVVRIDPTTALRFVVRPGMSQEAVEEDLC